MNKKLYNLMDWAAIEEIVYAEATHPEKTLGTQNVGKSTLVQAFFPDAAKVTLYIDGKEDTRGKRVKEEVKMDMADEAGFFAALLPGKDRTDYVYHVEYKDKKRKSRNFKEVYTKKRVLTDAEAEKINTGSDFAVYEKLGAHKKTVNGVRGCAFAVWAPNALRVSVVGEFNDWDGRVHQMTCIDHTGVFELFIPDVEYGDKYKFELLLKGAEKVMRCDPYAFSMQGAGYDSVVTGLNGFKWQDEKWLKVRKETSYQDKPLHLYELYLPAYLGENKEETLKTLAPKLAEYLKKMNYTHVELMPIAEYVENECFGYHTSGYYAPTQRYGTPEEYMYFVNTLHQAGIGVILQFNLSCFENGEYGLGQYDGTGLYEHEDYRKGIDARNGKYMFQYARPEVREFLISSLLFWVKEYHVDGFKFCDMPSILYLDYYRQPGAWVPNLYGGNENLESAEFLRKMNEVLHKSKLGIITIADEESGWPYVTLNGGNLSQEEQQQSLGFDFAVSHGFHNDVLDYMRHDPIERHAHHDALTINSVFQYRENYLLAVSHSDTDYNKGGLLNRMPGDEKTKLANLRAFYGYMMTHPGKKQMFMGQEQADLEAFWPDKKMEWEAASDKKEFVAYMEALNTLYKTSPALYQKDYVGDGFEWINDFSANENVLVFVRRSAKREETLLVCMNFANREYEKYKIGVPECGKYKEVFNSDAVEFGGNGFGNPRLVPAKEEECDEREWSVKVKLAPLSVTVFSYVPYSKEELADMAKKKAEKEAKRLEKERQKQALAKEKAKIRASLKEELARKIRDAEAAIAAGSETKGGKKK